MVERPLFELLTRVTLRFATSRPKTEPIYGDAAAVEGWKAGRHRIIEAILRRDEALARFEADRSNRRVVLDWLRRQGAARILRGIGRIYIARVCSQAASVIQVYSR